MPRKLRPFIAQLLGYHSPFAVNRSITRPRDVLIYYAALVSKTGPHPVIQDKAAALNTLHALFKERGIRSESLGSNWWSRFAQVITLSDQDGEQIQHELRKDIESISVTLMSWWELLSIYNLCLKFGLFNVAYGFRLKARETMLIDLQQGKVKPNSYHHLKALGTLLEMRNWSLLKIEIDKIGAWHSEDKYLFEFLYAIASDPAKLEELRAASIKSGLDRNFFNFNSNRTIAYVGPAKTENQDGLEIEKFDVVVRANHKYRKDAINFLVKGSRCEISYYNGLQSRHLASVSEALPAEIRFANAVETNFQYLKKLPKQPLLQLRTPRNHRSLLMQGSFHSMPNAILDLLKCYPKKIKIFHADLMLTVSRFEGYKAHAEKEAEHARIFIDTMKNHDPVAQFSFLEIAYKSGLLEGDSMFQRVMELGEEKYMQALQAVYGNFARVGLTPLVVK